jgi:hypothetical protein
VRTAYIVCALAAPMVIGYGVPALLAWRPGRCGAGRAGIFLGATLLALVALGVIAGRADTLVALVPFLLAFTALVVAIYGAFPSRAVGQLASGLAVTAMAGAFFAFARTIHDGLAIDEIRTRVTLAFGLAPWATIAESILGIDVRRGILYGEMADYLVDSPGWGSVAGAYALAAVPPGVVAFVRYRRQACAAPPPAPPPQPPP